MWTWYELLWSRWTLVWQSIPNWIQAIIRLLYKQTHHIDNENMQVLMSNNACILIKPAFKIFISVVGLFWRNTVVHPVVAKIESGYKIRLGQDLLVFFHFWFNLIKHKNLETYEFGCIVAGWNPKEAYSGLRQASHSVKFDLFSFICRRQSQYVISDL